MSKDILISFDSTGSMSPCIRQVRREVEKLVNDLFQFDDVRVGMVNHGDYCDGSDGYQALDFTSSKTKVIDFVNNSRNTSGGDADEFYEYVLQKAQAFSWQGEKRALVMIGDAEPHRVGYSYYGVTYRIDWKEEAQKLADMGVTIYPVQCLNHRTSNYFYEGLAKIGQAPKLELHQFADINRLLTAVFYKQVDDSKVTSYGEQLKASGQLNRNMANVLDLLLNSKNFLGGFGEVPTKTGRLEEVDPTRFQVLNVDDDISIRDFVTKSGATFKVGRGFYELTKRETVQEKKEVVLRNKAGDMFSGDEAREIIGIPYGVRGKVSPLDIGYDVFIQSTSYNRKLVGGTRFLYEVDKI